MLNRRQLAELGANLASAMNSDPDYRAYGDGLYRDTFDWIVDAYKADATGFCETALQAMEHAGLDADSVAELREWVMNRLCDSSGKLNVRYLWGLCADSTDDYGDDVPVPGEE